MTDYGRSVFLCLLVIFLPRASVAGAEASAEIAIEPVADFSQECSVMLSEGDWAFQNSGDSRPYILSSRWKENVEVEDGLCKFVQKKEVRGGKNWTSAHVWSRRSFLYGYYEAKIRFASSYGINNAFWLMGSGRRESDDGPIDCEIDIVEGRYPNVVTNNLHHLGGEATSDQKKFVLDDAILSDDFHIYGLEWTSETIRWFMDGKLLREQKNAVCHSELFLRLSTAVLNEWKSGARESIDGTSMDVDYVRVYKLQE